MNAQQLLDHIIVPTLKYMGGGYDSLNARMLLLSTAAIESNCGHYIKQVGGPALGIWQMEPATHQDINLNCDALSDDDGEMCAKQSNLYMPYNLEVDAPGLVNNPMYSCFMARLKYAMDPKRLPDHDDKHAIYDYYKRIYNTELGASTWDKFRIAWDINNLNKVRLSC